MIPHTFSLSLLLPLPPSPSPFVNRSLPQSCWPCWKFCVVVKSFNFWDVLLLKKHPHTNEEPHYKFLVFSVDNSLENCDTPNPRPFPTQQWPPSTAFGFSLLLFFSSLPVTNLCWAKITLKLERVKISLF